VLRLASYAMNGSRQMTATSAWLTVTVIKLRVPLAAISTTLRFSLAVLKPSGWSLLNSSITSDLEQGHCSYRDYVRHSHLLDPEILKIANAFEWPGQLLLPIGNLHPYLIHGSLGPPESSSRTALYQNSPTPFPSQIL